MPTKLLQPAFSIIIPTFRRPARLAECLRAIAEMDYPSELLEVVVVDDGGGDARAVVASQRSELTIQFLEQENRGPAAARNAGAIKAAKPYLAFLDDDCQPGRGWLKGLAAQLALTPDHMVGGCTVNRLTENAYSEASQLLVAYLYRYYGAAPGRPAFYTSNNVAVPAAQFRELGGFDTTFRGAAGEDREFCWRWRERGWRMSYCPDALVAHAHWMNWRGYWKQHFDYGRAAFHFHQIRTRAGQGLVRLEPPAFYGRLLLCPLEGPQDGRKLQLGMLLLVSQVANALGFFARLTEERRNGRPCGAG